MWTHKGSVAIPAPVASDEVMFRLRAALEAERKRPFEPRAGRIDFDDPIWRNFFVLPRPSLSFYDRGKFWIDASSSNHRLRYELESLHGFVFCVAVGALFFALQSGGRAASAAAIGFGAFAFLYGANLLWTRGRLQLLLEKVTGTGLTERLRQGS